MYLKCAIDLLNKGKTIRSKSLKIQLVLEKSRLMIVSGDDKMSVNAPSNPRKEDGWKIWEVEDWEIVKRGHINFYKALDILIDGGTVFSDTLGITLSRIGSVLNVTREGRETHKMSFSDLRKSIPDELFSVEDWQSYDNDGPELIIINAFNKNQE